MPDFPRYQSKGQLTTQQPSVEAPTDTTGQMLETGAKVAGQVSDVALKWSNAVDTIQKTTAQANFKTGMLDITQRAQNDPNYKNSDQYFREIDKLKTDNLKGFQSKTAETEMAIEFGYDSQVGKIQIDNLYKKKLGDVGQASILKNLEHMSTNANDLEKRIDKFLAPQIRDQIISHEQAYKLKEKYVTQGKFNSFLQDFRSNPVEAEKKFNKDAYGLDIETAEKARSKLKELKVLQKEQEGNLFGDMTLKLTTSELSEDEIDEAIALNKNNPNEGITEAHGKRLKDGLYKDVTKRIGTKEFKKYKQALDFVFSSSAQDRIKGYEAVLEAHNEGLDKEETKFLKQILDTKKDVVWANKAASGKKLIETIFGARPKDIQKETQSLLAYAKRIAKGASPETAAQETAIDIIQQDHPATVADPTLVGAFTPSKGFKNIPKVKSESSSGRQE